MKLSQFVRPKGPLYHNNERILAERRAQAASIVESPKEAAAALVETNKYVDAINDISLRKIANDVGSIRLIQAVTAKYYGVTMHDICGQSRVPKIVIPRQIAQYLCRTRTELSLPNIAKMFGGRDHTTILHSVRKIEREKARFANDLAAINIALDMVLGWRS